LLAGRYTPQLQAAMSRLGSKLPFRQAQEEVWYSHGVKVSEATTRRTTYKSGRAAETIVRQEVERLEREAPECISPGKPLILSADGTYVPLVGGEWREVKCLVVGEFERHYEETSWQSEVKTEAISYFARSYAIRDFERYALAELHRRGIEAAETVVAVNDGAEWIQSFLDYHCPEAIRIIDFVHALGYMAEVGRAVWGSDKTAFSSWLSHMAHQLKHRPPHHTVADLRLLEPKAITDEQAEALHRAIRYLQTRLSMVDYAHFRRRGYPIGSGCVESGHSVVVHSRLNQAGMHWASDHIDPMLAMRTLICNDRWAEGWQQIVAYQQQERHCRRPTVTAQPASQPVTFAALEAAGLLSKPEVPVKAESESAEKKSRKPAKDHPWRRGIWPTKESWRWN
jgi:hypothetical protein